MKNMMLKALLKGGNTPAKAAARTRLSQLPQRRAADALTNMRTLKDAKKATPVRLKGLQFDAAVKSLSKTQKGLIANFRKQL